MKVVFDVPEQDGSVYKTETLWAEPVGETGYRLRNVPFEAFGLVSKTFWPHRKKTGYWL